MVLHPRNERQDSPKTTCKNKKKRINENKRVMQDVMDWCLDTDVKKKKRQAKAAWQSTSLRLCCRRWIDSKNPLMKEAQGKGHHWLLLTRRRTPMNQTFNQTLRQQRTVCTTAMWTWMVTVPQGTESCSVMSQGKPAAGQNRPEKYWCVSACAGVVQWVARMGFCAASLLPPPTSIPGALPCPPPSS